MDIGNRIRNLRLAYGLTLKELAGKAGISISYLGDIEKNRSNPSVDTLRSIARALYKHPGYFLEESSQCYFGEQVLHYGNKNDFYEQFILRASKLSKEGKGKLWDFLDYVEHWEAEQKKKKKQ